MYGSPSPVFDTPELPSLRRMKPLPKRRRTSDAMPRDDALSEIPLSDLQPVEGVADASTQGFEDAISAQLALPSYYESLLSGVKDILKQGLEGRAPATLDLKGAGLSGGRNGRGFDDGGEGDYVDHLQQPGNTKKRKVPANLAAAGHAHETGSGQTSGEEEPVDRAIPTGRPENEYDNVLSPLQGTIQPTSSKRRGKLTKAMIAGIQHKEMLKNRKRQLAAVLGALTQGDTLALDQALSLSYPFATGLSNDQEPPRVRLSRRRPAVLARAFKAFRDMYPAPENTASFPTSEFTFTCDSATSERLRATKEEVAALHARFEAELKRQAAKASEVARQTSAVLTGSTSTPRNAKQGRIGTNQDAQTINVDQSLHGGTTPSKNKKKKRSARANASNPHHLRNYIPSRLPHSGQANATTLSAQDFLSPLPIRFLSTDIAPRRRKKSSVTPVTSLNNPIEEWICPFCEYDLFYGNDDDYRRAINNRKKILRRRRRARERAAAAANGTSTAVAPSKTPAAVEEPEIDLESPYPPEPNQVQGNGKQRRGNVEDRSGSNVANTAFG